MIEFITQLQERFQMHPWLWDVLAVTSLLLVAWLANWLTKHVLLQALRRLLHATVYREAEPDAEMRLTVIPRLANVVPALVLYAGLDVVPDLPDKLVIVLRALCQAFIVLTVALSVARALDVVSHEYERRPQAREKPIKGYLQVGKILVFVVAAISIFATLIGAKFGHVLTGLGAMTAVTMLVFQDTILSFVASVQIGSDGRVRVGDWIEMPAQNADGDVIDIALHTVTVQNWDKSITTIPTKKLISESFKNWRGMSEAGGRRIKRCIYIDQKSVRFLDAQMHQRLHRFSLLQDYLDAKDSAITQWNANLGAAGQDTCNQRRLTNFGTFRAYVERYLRQHPGIQQEMSLMVRQLQPDQAGIPLEIYCFSNDTRWAVYEGIQSDIFDHLLSILPEFGLSIFQASNDGPVNVVLTDQRH